MKIKKNFFFSLKLLRKFKILIWKQKNKMTALHCSALYYDHIEEYMPLLLLLLLLLLYIHGGQTAARDPHANAL